MLGIIADFLASITTILFPVFASYKALRTSDIAQLTPWLIYWIILSLFLLVESWTLFIIGWIPFYSWIRLFALSYLVLPQTQGAKLLYANYVEPFITSHERQIEDFIGDIHEQGSKAGLVYIKHLIDLIRQHALGLPPTREEPPAPPTAAGYAQSLLSRFAMPSARAPSTSDFYSMLSGAVAAATSTSTSTSTSRSSVGPRSTTNANPLIPGTITNPADKHSFLASQRENLALLMKALDREQRDLDLAYGNAPGVDERKLEADVERRARDVRSGSRSGSGQDIGGTEMRKNKSDASFQNIDREEVEEDEEIDAGLAANIGPEEQRKKREGAETGARTTSGSWLPTTWFGGSGGGGGGGGEKAESKDDESMGDVAAKEVRDAAEGMSSSIDRRR